MKFSRQNLTSKGIKQQGANNHYIIDLFLNLPKLHLLDPLNVDSL
jgi:hypothetical protein